MNPISIRSFPSQPLAKWLLGKPCPPAASQTLGAASRHLRWAAGITSKLARRSRWRGLHPEAMTLLHPSRMRILRLQTLIRQTHSEARLYSPIGRQNSSKFNGSDLPVKADQKPAPAPRTIIERNNSLTSFVREIMRHTAPAAASSAAIQRNRTVEFVDKIALPRISRSVLGNIGSAASLALSSPARAMMQSGHQPDEPDSAAATLPERVLRRHCRIEARPFLQSRGLAPQVVVAPTPEEPTAIHRASARRRAQQFDVPAETGQRSHSALQAPNVNVAQITDAVLQQLDRRLIAARERMGRI
jgi:hypothetical protein